MSFEDLPDDWTARPLHDPRLVADVLDLVVGEEDRRGGALGLLMCDREDRLRQPVLVTDLDTDVVEDAAEVCERALRIVADVLGAEGPGGLLVVRGRADGLSVTAADVALARMARAVCVEAGVRLLGVHLLTLSGSREVPLRRRAA